MIKEFPLAPLGRGAMFGLWLPLAAAMAVVAGGVLLKSSQEVPRQLLFFLPFVLLIGVVITVLARRRRIVLDQRELRITATLYRKQVAVDAIDLDKARVVDLAEHTELRPLVKTNGFNLPGLAAGHYRLRNLGKAFCLITDRSRVLALPLRAGSWLLLSPEKPRELLEQLRQLAASAPHR